MGKKYNLVVCPECRKHFNPKKEGFKVNEYLICADCYHKAKLKTIENGDYGKLWI